MRSPAISATSRKDTDMTEQSSTRDTATADEQGIAITRWFNAPRELVYAAWTEPAHFAHWFGTAAVDVPVDSVSFDLRVGGRWAAKMVFTEPQPMEMPWSGEFLEVTGHRRIVQHFTQLGVAC